MKITATIDGDRGVVTLTPCWLARLFGARARRGEIRRTENGDAYSRRSQGKAWYWVVTERVCEEAIHRAIETAEVTDLPRAEARP